MLKDSRYVSYDPNRSGSNITGIYSSKELAKTTEVILISGLEVDQYKAAPNEFRVDENKRFIRINRDIGNKAQSYTVAKERELSKDEILQPIKVSLDKLEFEYIPDISMQLNLMTGLHLTLAEPKAKCKLWCKSSNGDWMFREHSYEQLVLVAKAINARRESISENTYASF